MKILDRYILSTFLVPLTYCLIAFSLVFIIVDLFDSLQDFLDAGTALHRVVQYNLLLLPAAAIYIAPISLMLAVLYCLSQLTRHNEITAMLASGISLVRIVVPFLFVGLAASLAVTIINETAAPLSAAWTDQFMRLQKNDGNESVFIEHHLPLKNLPEQRDWMVHKFNARTYEMEMVQIVQKLPGGGSRKIQARRGTWLDGRWWLEDVVSQQYNERGDPVGRPLVMGTLEMTELNETPRDFLNERKEPDELSALEIHDYIARHDLAPETIDRLMVDFHSRVAMPWTCFVVTVMGIPFGTQSGRRGAMLGILLTLVIFFGYYFFMLACIAAGKSGLLPPWVAGWTPIVAFGSLAAYLAARHRH
jgi:lipopolysaccharide export system permease protein